MLLFCIMEAGAVVFFFHTDKEPESVCMKIRRLQTVFSFHGMIVIIYLVLMFKNMTNRCIIIMKGINCVITG